MSGEMKRDFGRRIGYNCKARGLAEPSPCRSCCSASSAAASTATDSLNKSGCVSGSTCTSDIVSLCPELGAVASTSGGTPSCTSASGSASSCASSSLERKASGSKASRTDVSVLLGGVASARWLLNKLSMLTTARGVGLVAASSASTATVPGPDACAPMCASGGSTSNSVCALLEASAARVSCSCVSS